MIISFQVPKIKRIVLREERGDNGEDSFEHFVKTGGAIR